MNTHILEMMVIVGVLGYCYGCVSLGTSQPTIGDLCELVDCTGCLTGESDTFLTPECEDYRDALGVEPVGLGPDQIPAGFYFGNGADSFLEMRVDREVVNAEERDDAIISITFDYDGWPMNYDDTLGTDVRIYIGYQEDSTIDLEITDIRVEGGSVTIESMLSIPELGIKGTNQETYTYYASDPACPLYHESEFYLSGDDSLDLIEMEGFSKGCADGPS